MTLRWYIESGRSSPGEVSLEYEFVSEDGIARRCGGAYLDSARGRGQDEVLVSLISQLEGEGYDVTVEHGHYTRVWVPDER